MANRHDLLIIFDNKCNKQYAVTDSFTLGSNRKLVSESVFSLFALLLYLYHKLIYKHVECQNFLISALKP